MKQAHHSNSPVCGDGGGGRGGWKQLHFAAARGVSSSKLLWLNWEPFWCLFGIMWILNSRSDFRLAWYRDRISALEEHFPCAILGLCGILDSLSVFRIAWYRGRTSALAEHFHCAILGLCRILDSRSDFRLAWYRNRPH